MASTTEHHQFANVNEACGVAAVLLVLGSEDRAVRHRPYNTQI